MKKILGTVNPSILQTGIGKAWDKFPKEAVASPLLKIFKNRLKKHLANMTLGIAGPALEHSGGTRCLHGYPSKLNSCFFFSVMPMTFVVVNSFKLLRTSSISFYCSSEKYQMLINLMYFPQITSKRN